MAKVLILFILISVCGSLSNKPIIQPCSKTLTMTLYKNGKLIKIINQDGLNISCGRIESYTYNGVEYFADSIRMEIYYEPPKNILFR